jgi:hypothetical protein
MFERSDAQALGRQDGDGRPPLKQRDGEKNAHVAG